MVNLPVIFMLASPRSRIPPHSPEPHQRKYTQHKQHGPEYWGSCGEPEKARAEKGQGNYSKQYQSRFLL